MELSKTPKKVFKCMVPGCDYKDRGHQKFHRFPMNPEQLRAWANFCQIDSIRPKDSICNRHFRDEDYQMSFRVLNRPRKFWKLNRDANPSLCGPECPSDVAEDEEPLEVPREIITADLIEEME